MMYKIRSFNDLISLENEECTCFGASKHYQEQFLAKQNSQPASSQSNTFKNGNNEPPIKGSFKKSLKKQFVAAFLPSKQTTPYVAEGHQQMKSPDITQKPREIREFLSPQNRFGAVNQKTYPVAAEPLNAFYPMKTPMREIFSCKPTQPYSQQPISPFPSFPTKAVGSPTHSPKPTKIQYNTTIAQKSPQPDRRPQQKRTFSPLSSKSVNREHYTVSSTIKPDMQEHHQREIERSESSRIIKTKVNDEKLKKDEGYKSCVKFATLKSVISPSKNKNDTIKSKIDTTQSGIAHMKSPKADSEKILIQPLRSKIQLKSMKDHKASLKKMDDVVEIYSQPDSQEHSDSDKQSIVLGRLNEYGSMIAPISYNSIIQENFTRFNSLTVDLSEAIKRIQQADKQFLTY